MTEESKKVKRLEDIALEVAYREIIFNLLLSPEHISHEQGTVMPFSFGVSCSSLISLNCFTSTSIIKFVRDRLDENLVGTMSDSIRTKLIQKFVSQVEKNSHQSKLELPDAWTFFNCVLDESFTTLDIPNQHRPHLGTDAKVFEAVSLQSPLLTSLTVNFQITGKGNSLVIQSAFEKCLISLQHLTSLSLDIQKNSSAISNCSYISLLSHLGICCPQLADLSLSRKLGEEHILALFLGQRASLIPSAAKQKMWGKHWSNMHKVQIANEHLSPICFSLVTLAVGFPVDESKDCSVDLRATASKLIP